MKLAIAQINTIVGDLEGNTKKIISYIEKARKKKADIVVFPEMAITGYPTQDLLFKTKFLKENKKKLRKIVSATKDITAIVGFVDYDEKDPNKRYNSAAIIRDKKMLFTQNKLVLPNYDVFVEPRYFKPGKKQRLFSLNGKKIGVLICEDLWVNEPAIGLKKLGADVMITISCSPFHVGKIGIRRRLLEARAKQTKAAQVYVNLVGGQDDLIFDGRCLVTNEKGEFLHKCPRFEESLAVVDLDKEPDFKWPKVDLVKETYGALLLGIRDYVRKNNFNKVVVGLSGGIDSALTITLATLALGKENVIGVTMPSPYTSKNSVEDAKHIAKNLGIKHLTIPITGTMKSYDEMLKKEFKGKKKDITEENIQARIRGNILMGLSNKFGWLLLSTGNKSEMAVGYCTLYGDLTGGLAVLSDVLKTTVYKLSWHINEIFDKELIPGNIITKEPSAELRKGQKDRDSLPPYAVLDKILHYYVDLFMSKNEIIAKGLPKATVSKVIKLVDRAEYKRQQMPIGIKITPKAFGSGRRMPITNKWEG